MEMLMFHTSFEANYFISFIPKGLKKVFNVGVNFIDEENEVEAPM
jgi:hypothetical protein